MQARAIHHPQRLDPVVGGEVLVKNVRAAGDEACFFYDLTYPFYSLNIGDEVLN